MILNWDFNLSSEKMILNKYCEPLFERWLVNYGLSVLLDSFIYEGIDWETKKSESRIKFIEIKNELNLKIRLFLCF